MIDKKMINKQRVKEFNAVEICEAIGDGISIQDTNFKILYENKIHKNMVGDHRGKYCYKAYQHKGKVCEGCPLAITFKDGLIHTKERSITRNNEIRYFEITASPLRDATGEIVAGIEVVRNITERKKAEKMLNESKRFLSNIFSSIQDGISILDKDMNIISVNPTMEQWYSHAMPLVGKKCYEAYHSQNKTCDICPTKQTFKTGKTAYEVIPKRDPNGETIGWLDLYSFPLVDTETDELKGVIQYVHDITVHKNLEKELQERVAELEKFYNIAIERELEMGVQRKEIKRLKSILAKS